MNRFNNKLSLLILFYLINTNCYLKASQINVVQYQDPEKITLPQDNSTTKSYQFNPPLSWKKQDQQFPARLATFTIDPNLEVTISELAGQGGDVIMNINRWREQIALPSLSTSLAQKLIQEDKGKLGPFKWTLLTSSHPKTQTEAILVCFFQRSNSTLFVKMKDKIEKIKQHQVDFLQFCRDIYEQ